MYDRGRRGPGVAGIQDQQHLVGASRESGFCQWYWLARLGKPSIRARVADNQSQIVLAATHAMTCPMDHGHVDRSSQKSPKLGPDLAVRRIH
jgi:hypothetical protein